MKLVFLGGPGAGKGTQAELLSSSKSIPHISTGAMLREAVQAGTDLGKRVGDIIDAGKLIPDETMIEVVRDRLSQSDCSGGYILDGFPRTLAQARALTDLCAELGRSIDAAVLFDVPRAELVKRLAGRRGVEQRADDSEEVQKERIQIYEEQTTPVIDYYQQRGELHKVDSLGGVEEVTKNLSRTLEKL